MEAFLLPLREYPSGRLEWLGCLYRIEAATSILTPWNMVETFCPRGDKFISHMQHEVVHTGGDLAQRISSV